MGAALARAALPFLDEENAARRRSAEHLRKLVADIPWIAMPPEPEGTESVHHLMSLIYRKEAAGIPRSEFLARLAAFGADTFVYIPTPIHKLRRLDWEDPAVPAVFWHRQLREAGIRYGDLCLRGAETRSATSFEMAWNWTIENPRAMQQLAAALRAAGGQSDPSDLL